MNLCVVCGYRKVIGGRYCSMCGTAYNEEWEYEDKMREDENFDEEELKEWT